MKQIFLCAILFFDLTASAQSLDELFSTQFSPSDPGGAVIVSSHGKVVYKKAFGRADLELDVNMKPEHVFRIGSITKQFTAVAILQLVEKGLVGLKDDITKFLPDYPTHGYSIRVENLLSHTSGIRNMPDTKDMNVGTRLLTPAEIIDTFKNESMDFEPGTQYRYCNSGYIILGYIIEKVSGLKYEEYLLNNIFKPAGMNHAFYDDPMKVITNRTKGYQQIRNDPFTNADYLNTSIPFAAGGLVMTVEDLLSWHQALIENRLLKKETLSLAQTSFTLKDGTKTKYGFGWDLTDVYGSAAFGHTGSINGYASMEIYLPREDVFVAILCNKVNVNSNELMRLATCLVTSNPITKEIDLPANVLKDYMGVYKFKFDQPSIIRVFERGGKYFMQDSRSSRAWRMHFTSDTDFYCFEVFPNNHIFTKDASGKVDGFLIKAPSYETRITKVE